jgi:hypothetical protein
MTDHRRVFHPKLPANPLRVGHREISLLVNVKDSKDDEGMLPLFEAHAITRNRAANQLALDSHIAPDLLDLRRDTEPLGDLPEEIFAVVKEVNFPTADAYSTDTGDSLGGRAFRGEVGQTAILARVLTYQVDGHAHPIQLFRDLEDRLATESQEVSDVLAAFPGGLEDEGGRFADAGFRGVVHFRNPFLDVELFVEGYLPNLSPSLGLTVATGQVFQNTSDLGKLFEAEDATLGDLGSDADGANTVTFLAMEICRWSVGMGHKVPVAAVAGGEEGVDFEVDDWIADFEGNMLAVYSPAV